MSLLRRGNKFAFRVVAQRTGRVDWSDCYHPYTPQPLKDNLNSLSRRLTAAKTVVDKAPKAVPAIDWDSYVARGVDAGEVAELKKQYESLKAPTVSSDAAADVSKIENFIKEFRGVAEPKIAAAQERKELLLKAKATLQEDFLTQAEWTLDDWERRFPGMLTKSYDAYMMGEGVDIEELAAPIESIDSAELARQLKAGEKPTAIMNIPQEAADYCWGGVTSTVMPPNDKLPQDDVENLKLPGSDAEVAAWNEEWGPVWAKLA